MEGNKGMTTVILAEKPDQARSYMDGLGIYHSEKQHRAEASTFLDEDTIVISAAGHLLELCEPEHYGEQYKDRRNIEALPIIPARFDYTLGTDKQVLFNEIKAAVSKADTVIVATDKDNEGGAIAYNILRFSGLLKKKKIKRALPSALNKEAVVRMFKNLKPIDSTWREAQAAIARGRSDWMIGMNLSRLYTSKLGDIGINGNYAVGRSISTTLNLICQWYTSIDEFKKEPIFELHGKTSINNVEVDLFSKIRKVGENSKHEFIQELKKHKINQKEMNGQVALIESETKERYPSIMFTKGDLYKEMARVAGWSQSRSKKVMQENYDNGYQTYPRTDSGKIPMYEYQYMLELFDKFLVAIGCPGEYAKYVMPEDKLKKYVVSDENSDAHYGIMPTEKIMDESCDVTKDQRLMYEVVTRKALTLVIEPYTYVGNKLGIMVNDVPFLARNTSMVKIGWRDLVLPNKKGKAKKEIPGINYSEYVKKGDELKIDLQNLESETKPPKPLKSIQIYDKGGVMERAYKYVENEKYASILKKANGIGTSATRDQAMASLVQKGYITVDTKDVISVTANGWLIDWLLTGSEVNDPILTAKWEDTYQQIEKGKTNANDLINETAKLIYSEFDRVNRTWDTEKISEFYTRKVEQYNRIVSLGECPICHSDIVYKKDNKNSGKYDNYSCANKECEFVIWRHYANRLISEADVKKLLNDKPTHEFKKLKSKSGKEYDAKLILEKNVDGKYKVVPLFDNNSKRKKKA